MLINDFVMQGGVRNYLGETQEVTAPKFWQSSENSPPTELAYITEAEKGLLLDANLHGSLVNNKPNVGASGLLSFDGWGSEDPGQNRAGGDVSRDMDRGRDDGNDRMGSSTGGGSQFHGTSTPDLPPGVTDVGNNPISEDIDEAYTDTSFNVNATNKKSLSQSIIDYIKGGGIIGAILRGIAGKLNPENKYEGITGEDGIGEGDFVYSSVNEYAQGEYGLNYKDLDTETQAEIDQKFYDSGHRSKAFQELYREGDTSNIENLTNQERQAIEQIIPHLAHEVGGTTEQESMVNKYFANLNNNNLGINADYLNTYNTAKTNMAGILDLTPNTQQYGYENTYASNYPRAMNSGNVFYSYLNEEGLI